MIPATGEAITLNPVSPETGLRSTEKPDEPLPVVSTHCQESAALVDDWATAVKFVGADGASAQALGSPVTT